MIGYMIGQDKFNRLTGQQPVFRTLEAASLFLDILGEEVITQVSYDHVRREYPWDIGENVVGGAVVEKQPISNNKPMWQWLHGENIIEKDLTKEGWVATTCPNDFTGQVSECQVVFRSEQALATFGKISTSSSVPYCWRVTYRPTSSMWSSDFGDNVTFIERVVALPTTIKGWDLLQEQPGKSFEAWYASD